MLYYTWLILLLFVPKISPTSSAAMVRLVNGINPCSGRVEVFHNGQWGRVCHDDWDWNDAAVVCREMGCGSAKEAKQNAYFGHGSGPIWMNKVKCYGFEPKLATCAAEKWGAISCKHEMDAGVICWRNIRLVNGIDSCSGTVEVYHKWWWGTVCDDDWDLSDAAVVCRELGCGNAIEAKSGARYKLELGQIWMNNVNCAGNEVTLSTCESRKWGISYCDNSKLAGVICQSSVRLVNGSNSCSGRVEVFYNGIWGSVCDSGWDSIDAAVVCKEVGCGNIIDAKSGAYYGQGSGPVWISDLKCNVFASTLSNCASGGWGKNSCGHEKDAGVFCQPKLRLVNGFNSCSGRVEVLHNGIWGTVCDNAWNLSDAAVVCREVGCGDVIEAKGGAYFGEGSGPIWMDNINCSGNESTVSSCESRKWEVYDCDHSKDAGVICHSLTKLVNGSNSCSGRVEVFYDNQWGTVCDNQWDYSDAAVLCREMGCESPIEAKLGAYFGQGSGPVWLSDLQCYNTESTLRDCKSTGWEKNRCGHEKDAGIVCQSPIRLVNGKHACSGRVEVLHNGIWGTVCDDGWDLLDAAVVCRELGCGDEPKDVKGGAYFGQGSGPIWMNGVNCFGHESTLMSCMSDGWGSHYCGHEQDAGVVCVYPKILLRIKVKSDAGVDPNDAGIMNELLKEMGVGLQTNGEFSLTWRIQRDGKIFQKEGIAP